MKQANKMIMLLISACISICSAPLAQKFHVIDVDKGTHSFPMNNYWDNYYDAGYSTFEDAVLNGIAYFSADDGIHGRELWRSDGTNGGTWMIKDINPGNASSDVHDIVVSGGKLYFSANDNVHGAEIWMSDGTTQGTKMLKDLYPGSASSSPSYLIDANGSLYFFGNRASTADELWKTDGTKEGTVRVANFYSAKFGYSGYASRLANVNSKVFFTLNGQLYTSNGTPDGTVLVKGIFVAPPSSLTAFKGLLYFSADDGSGRKLWVSDGTDGGTYSVNNNNNVNLYQDDLNKFVIKGNKLFFPGYSPDNDGAELCSYDISNPSNNVEIVKDFVPGSPSHNMYNLINVNGTIFFTVYAGTNTDQMLWKSDGTTAGTKLVKDINPGGLNIYWYKEFKNANGTLLFSYYDNVHGTELWKSDGTQAGTTIVKELTPGIYGSGFYSGDAVPNITYIGNNITLFQATDQKTGMELWKTDGTEAGTKLVKDINQSATYSSYPVWLTSMGGNGKLIFGAGTLKYSGELWGTDGYDAKLLKDIVPGSQYGGFPFALQNVKNTTYFFASIFDTTLQNTSDPSFVLRLFKTDGTSSGTKIIRVPALENTINNNGALANVCATSNLYYILVFNFTTFYYELWRTDGTEAGTFAVKTDLDPNFYPSPTPSGNTLFFTNYDFTYGDELWKTNGSVAGTKMVKDITPGPNSSSPYNLYAYNGKVYFNATDANFQTYIWSSDGTAAGTRPARKTVLAYSWIGGANGKLLFVYSDIYHGDEPWVTDGTASGTKLMKDIWPGQHGSSPGISASTGSLVYFTATTPSYGSEIWKSDGTREGTKLVKDITPGESYSFLSDFVTANDKLYFTNFNDNGSLWSSDGTRDGTARINDAGLTDVSQIGNLTPAGDKLYFTAFANATGYELYVGDIACNSNTSSDTSMIVKQNFDDQVYPNPVRDVLHVYISGKATFVLINQSGKQILTQTIINSGTINVANLAAGIYYLKNSVTDQIQKIVVAK